ncbi:MAG: homocysteine S-methyltransferase family protein, partial [Anaerolineae bacterium]|nr:homocysteine S-methyltransferase family protein [Anaerolineae bacterium]
MSLNLEERLKRGEVIIMDGGTGTEIERRGVTMDDVTWSGTAVQTHPNIIRQIHEDYITAGADIIITNTFSTGKHVLEPAGLGDQFESLNRQAVKLAQEARDNVADRPIFIAGSISTFVAYDNWAARPTSAEAIANYREQAHILAEAGVDLIMLEMLKDIEHSRCAVEGALTAGVPVWLGFSCKVIGNDILLYKQENTLAEGLAAMTPLGGSLVAIMHSLIDYAEPALKLVADTWAGPKGVYLHSGAFEMPIWQFDDIISPEDYAQRARKWVEYGYQVIGGCCGTTPE